MKSRLYAAFVTLAIWLLIAVMWPLTRIRSYMKTLALIAAIALTSCAEYPIAIAVQGEHGVYSYSAKDGIVITVQK